MKNLVLFVLIILSFANCREDKTTNSVDSGETRVSTTKKDKFLIESQREVNELETSIEVKDTDFQSVKLFMFPSFDEAHAINLDFIDKKVRFSQITQSLYNNMDDEAFKLDGKKREEYLFKRMISNKSKRIEFEIKPEEEKELISSLKFLKQAKYKFKNVEMFDGANFFMTVYENDTIVFLNTNAPSIHQTKLLKTLFELCDKYAEDSITKRNINRLKEYL